QREGVFFCALSPVGATARYERFLALHVILIVPGTAGDFLFWWKSLRGGKPFWKKVLPPRAPPFQKLLPVSLCRDGKSACEPREEQR
ncbi:hypothetical protein, partial [Desulfovibrio piger]|uniref:hypothetical protein n=1 Tax=Desulfovibrio piger TaxID=901 RepID=UPI002942B488